MKLLLLSILFLLMVVAVPVSAQVNDDSVLVVPKTSMAPVIDGEMDDVWKYVGETLLIKGDAADTVIPDDWFDLFGSMRLMFDDNNLYLLLQVQDELINAGTDYNTDGVELYFDGDNSKTFENYDGVDDIQMRFNVGENTTDLIDLGYGNSTSWGYDPSTIDFVIWETDIGWTLEAALPLADLQLYADSEFGFDAQLNDADESTRESMYRWWGTDNNAWIHADLFGTAFLDGKRVINGEYLGIPKGTAPTIDGKLAYGEWKDAVEASVGTLDASNTVGFINGWEDTRAWFYAKWDNANFYYAINVWDEYYDYAPDEATGWTYDSIELFFDGDNAKTEGAYDGVDDVQIRFNLGQEGADLIDVGYGDVAGWNWDKTTTNYAVLESDLGWICEAAIPLGDMQIPVGQEFGFEMQLNDNDDPSETDQDRTMYRWWSADGNEWHYANLFGTAVLVPAFAAVEDMPAVTVQSYDLAQNYPNPFNPTTNISYSVAKMGKVDLKVYDLLGKEVATLVNEVKSAGQYTATFNGSNLSSGVYLYTLKSGDQTFTKKMSLVK
jgi:hypothetical protein